MLFEHSKTLLLIPVAVTVLFLIMRFDFVKLKGERWKQFQKSKVRKRLVVFGLRLIVVVCLIVALANPIVQKQDIAQGDPSLTILADQSASFNLFDTHQAEKLKQELSKDIPVKLKAIGTENSSPLGDELLASMIGNDNLLLVTDGRVTKGRSLGDVMVVASAINSTISALYLDPIKSDLAVRIEGPRITTVGIENEFLARVDQTSPPGSAPESYTVTVKLDGDVMLEATSEGTNSFKFSRKFTEGYHELKAELTPSGGDYFKANNAFLKSVKVEQKPKVLLVSPQGSPLEQLFSPVYELTTTQTMAGKDFNGYSAVILNDIPASGIDTDKISEFIDKGNGLVVFGGSQAYDKGDYKGKPIENLLPVKVGTGEEGTKKFVNVVIVMDISGSTGSGFGAESQSTVEEVEKALAIGIIKDLRPDDRLGIIAFNSQSYTVIGLESVASNRNQAIGKVQSLIYTGGTSIEEGMSAARKMLMQADGSKNIVLLSDGKSGTMAQDLIGARYAAEEGMKVYSVGVGEETDANHMTALADKGKGIYLEPTEAQKLKIIFGSAQTAPTDKMKLEKLNGNHFITKNVKLNARLSGFNQVVPKPNADVLVATAENRPIITTWRFGLGRITSVATDDGTGWAGELLNKDNSILLTRTVNWAIGDLGRNKDFDVNARDTFLGNKFSIEVTSDEMPVQEGLTFTKDGERSFGAEYSPDQVGWYRFFDASAAANYPQEILNTGHDPDLSVLVQMTGGEIFRPGQEKDLLKKIRQDSRRIVTSQKSLAWIPLSMAIVAFLIDIAARKAFEREVEG